MAEAQQASQTLVPIAEVSSRTGLSADTLRLHQRAALPPPFARTTGGQRRYSQRDLERITFLLRLRDTGTPLAAMARFADLRRDGETARPSRLAMLVQHRRAVAQQLQILRENLRAIEATTDRHRRILRRRGGPTMTTDAFALGPIHHVQLAVPRGQEQQCRAFWSGVLGMDEVARPPVLAARGGCWFAAGALQVHLGVEEPFAPAAKAHPALLVEGIAALAQHLEGAGHPVTWDEHFPGHQRFYAADPFGNRLEFLQPHFG